MTAIAPSAPPGYIKKPTSLQAMKTLTAQEAAAPEGREFRVLVCGGRNYQDSDHVHNTLCALDAERGPITCIIHGAATGADTEGMRWAQLMATAPRKITHAPFAADWRTHGRAAGPIRNQRMLDEGHPDLVVAFPGGRGTADMVRRAQRAGVEVIQVQGREEYL
jgi:hypothetical protein